MELQKYCLNFYKNLNTWGLLKLLTDTVHKKVNEMWIMSLKLFGLMVSFPKLKPMSHTLSFALDGVSPDRNSWLKTPQHPERLESSFYDGWLYVETECVRACVFACVRTN